MTGYSEGRAVIPLTGPFPSLSLPPSPLASRDSTLCPQILFLIRMGIPRMRKSKGFIQVAPEFCTGVGLGELKGGSKALVTLNRLSGGQSLLESRGSREPQRQG